MSVRKRAMWAGALGLIAAPALVGIVGATTGEEEVERTLSMEVFEESEDGTKTRPPRLTGDLSKGTLRTDLYRGVAVPDEITVVRTPGECQNHMRLRMSWDAEQNYVRVHLKGENVLDPSPSFTRTEGVNFSPNEYWPEVKDIENGKNLFWVISPVEAFDVYYDAQTLKLLGSVYDYDTPPDDVITISVPGFAAIATDFIEVEENGDVDWTYTFAYDSMQRGDYPDYGPLIATFVPTTLCDAHPTDYTQTSTRPLAAVPPPEEAPSFEEMLRNGLVFDTTIEPAQTTIDPPLSTNIATFSGSLLTAGGVPKGWTSDIEAVFANLAPPIRRWEGAGSCTDVYKPVRTRDFNACEAAGEEGGAP